MSYEIIPTGGVDVKKLKVNINNNIEDRYLIFIKSDSNNTFPRNYKWRLHYVTKTKEEALGIFQNFFNDLYGGNIQPTDCVNLSGYETYKVFVNRCYKLTEKAEYIKEYNEEERKLNDKNFVLTDEYYKNKKSYNNLDNIILNNIYLTKKSVNLETKQYTVLTKYDLEKVDTTKNEEEQQEYIENILNNYKNTIFYPKNYNYDYVKDMDVCIQNIIIDKTSCFTENLIDKILNPKLNNNKNFQSFRIRFFEQLFNQNYIDKTLNMENKLLVEKDVVFKIFKYLIENSNFPFFYRSLEQFITKTFPEQFSQIFKENKNEVIELIKNKNIEIKNSKNNYSEEELLLNGELFDTKRINDELINNLQEISFINKKQIENNKENKTERVIKRLDESIEYIIRYKIQPKWINKYIKNLYDSLENRGNDLNVELIETNFKNILKKREITDDSLIKFFVNYYADKRYDNESFKNIILKHKDKYINNKLEQEILTDVKKYIMEKEQKNDDEIRINNFFNSYFYIHKFKEFHPYLINKIIKKLNLKKDFLELLEKLFLIDVNEKYMKNESVMKNSLINEKEEKIKNKLEIEQKKELKKKLILEAKNKFNTELSI